MEGDDARCFDAAFAAILDVSTAAGVDHHYGRRPGTVLRQAGLIDLLVEGHVSEWNRGQPIGELFRLTFQRIHGRVIATGSLTGDKFKRLFDLVECPMFSALGNIVFFARGDDPADLWDPRPRRTCGLSRAGV